MTKIRGTPATQMKAGATRRGSRLYTKTDMHPLLCCWKCRDHFGTDLNPTHGPSNWYGVWGVGRTTSTDDRQLGRAALRRALRRHWGYLRPYGGWEKVAKVNVSP